MSQNPISCEPCRQKKCKSNLLPMLQHALAVHLPRKRETSRGLPQGYITHLEHRLIETELALYTLYTQLRSAGLHTETPALRIPPTVPDRLARQSRTTNMEEWERLPLRDPRDWERWWTEKRGLFGEDGSGEAQTGEEVPGQGTESREGDAAPPQGDSSGRLPGKAEELVRAEPNIYF
ncbi:Zn(II)2Cys6 transcription factor [Aspergillus terreus]|uniref:Zn(II)2Cys6 transcription factor n=1 Tax=Aspergillus terreus TaxID=33178 RepID=A0A5M3YPM9_ASPTE|nr:hypothetical protein ATETN484_0001090600 [Aspergillus terreus]GFF12761.1 Zn(II)2Cys6 transcription factor [Aspergillus terreus]